MKKLVSLFTILVICMAMAGCTQGTSEQKASPLPQLPVEIYAVNEITDDSMIQLENIVSGLTVADFLHPDRIDMIEKQGFRVSVENIKVADCNSITFEVVLTKSDGNALKIPAVGMLMYQYLPMNDEKVAGLHILWGNVAVYDEQVVLVNVDTMSLWHTDSLQPIFRQPELTVENDDGFFFILDAVKNEDGYLLPYFSSQSSGLMSVKISGNVASTPLKETEKLHTVFGGYKYSESFNFNTTARGSTLLHCVYGEDASSLFISRMFINGYMGSDYELYDFEKGEFVSSYLMASYSISDYEYNVFGMLTAEAADRYKDTVFVAERLKDGIVVDMVVFKADINPTEFGVDKRTGWNTYSHINLSEDMDVINFGCSKTNTVITIDFGSHTADVKKTGTMPQMLVVDTAPDIMNTLYRAWNKQDTALVVGYKAGVCTMEQLVNVSGVWGVNWLAGFHKDNYIYVLTEDAFIVYQWEYGDGWRLIARTSGNYKVDADTVNRLCDVYA